MPPGLPSPSCSAAGLPFPGQSFTRIDAPSIAGADDARFAFFRDRLLPDLAAGEALLPPFLPHPHRLTECPLRVAAGVADGSGCPAGHTLIFVPSYFDYVRLRNLLDSKASKRASTSPCLLLSPSPAASFASLTSSARRRSSSS